MLLIDRVFKNDEYNKAFSRIVFFFIKETNQEILILFLIIKIYSNGSMIYSVFDTIL